MWYCCGYCKLEYLWGYSVATVTGAKVHAVAAEYLLCTLITLKGTPICSSHIGSAWYETCVAGQGESGCVVLFCTFKPSCKTMHFSLIPQEQWRSHWGGKGGQSATPDSENLPKIGENSGKIGKKSGKIRKKRQKSGSFFHFAPADR